MKKKEMSKEELGKVRPVDMAKKALPVLAALLLFMAAPMALFADDPLDVINNLTDFIFLLVKGVGLIVIIWGVVQIGMSLQSHDPSQRTTGFLSFAGGLLFFFAKEVLALIGVS